MTERKKTTKKQTKKTKVRDATPKTGRATDMPASYYSNYGKGKKGRNADID